MCPASSQGKTRPPLPEGFFSYGPIKSKPGEEFGEFVERVESMTPSRKIVFRVKPGESFPTFKSRLTHIFPELKIFPGLTWIGMTKPNPDGEFVAREIRRRIFAGVPARSWGGASLVFLSSAMKFRRPPINGKEVLDKLKTDQELHARLQRLKLSIEEVAEIAIIGLIFGRRHQKATPGPYQADLEPPVKATREILSPSRRKYWLLKLLDAASGMENILLPLLNKHYCWGDPDKPSEPVYIGPFQKLPSELREVVQMIKQIPETELRKWLKWPSYVDRRAGDRSLDSCACGLVRLFKWKIKEPRYDLVADIIQCLLGKTLGADGVQKIFLRESRRLERLIPKA